jgi:hypothetical protein
MGMVFTCPFFSSWPLYTLKKPPSPTRLYGVKWSVAAASSRNANAFTSMPCRSASSEDPLFASLSALIINFVQHKMCRSRTRKLSRGTNHAPPGGLAGANSAGAATATGAAEAGAP